MLKHNQSSTPDHPAGVVVHRRPALRDFVEVRVAEAIQFDSRGGSMWCVFDFKMSHIFKMPRLPVVLFRSLN